MCQVQISRKWQNETAIDSESRRILTTQLLLVAVAKFNKPLLVTEVENAIRSFRNLLHWMCQFSEQPTSRVSIRWKW